MITLQRIEGFYWVAKECGFARAARAFPYPITQPGVHLQVRRLEEELGAPLFTRVGKDRMALTSAGRRLFEAVAPLYERLRHVERELRDGTLGGTLRIQAAGFALRHVAPPWLARIAKAHPNVALQLQEVGTPELGPLRRGEAELLVDWLDPVPKDLRCSPLAEARAFVVAPGRGGPPKLASLKDAPFIAYGTDARLFALQRAALAEHGIVPKTALAADSSDTIVAFVAAGLGWSLVPSVDARGPRVPGVRAAPLQRPAVRFTIAAFCRAGAPPDPVVEAALALVQP